MSGTFLRNWKPPPKKFSRPHAPPDHIFSTFSEELQQAIINNNLEEIQDLLQDFKIHVLTHPDYFKFDGSELNKHLKIAREIHKDKDRKQMSAEHLYVEEKSTETKAPWVCNLPCTIQYLQVQQWGVQHPEIKINHKEINTDQLINWTRTTKRC